MPFTENDNPLSLPVNFLLSPVHGLVESFSGIPIPGVQGLAQDWLDSGAWEGVEEFKDDHPFLSGAATFASYLVPGVAYANVGRGLGALPGLTRAAASLGGQSAGARFALGETARWAPLTAGTVGFDAAAGRYESPGEAVTDFVLGTALGGALSAAGASNAFRSAVREIPGVGGLVDKGLGAFGPTPAQRTMYGLGPELAEDPAIQELSPLFAQEEPGQVWGRRANQYLQEINDGTRPDSQRATLLSLTERLRADAFSETAGEGELYARFTQPTNVRTRRMVQREFSLGPGGRVGNALNSEGKVVGQRSRLTQKSKASLADWRRIGEELDLPWGWEFQGRFFRHRTADQGSAHQMRRTFGLLQPTDKAVHPWRRVTREVEGPDGPYSQVWSIMPEEDGGWLMATELPVAGDGKQSRFLLFKTDTPEAFVPDLGWARNIDNPHDLAGMGESLGRRPWELEGAYERGKSRHLDDALGLKETIFSPEMFRAVRNSAARGNKRTASLLAQKLGKQSIPGANLGALIERYLKPTNFQLRNNPEAAFVFNFRQALVDRFEGEAQARLFGNRKLSANQSIWQSMFGRPATAEDSIFAATEKFWKEVQADPAVWREFQENHFHKDLPNAEWDEGVAKEYHAALEKNAKEFVEELNLALEAVGAEPIAVREGHIGISHSHQALGSNYYPVLDFQGNVIGLGVGESAEQAHRQAGRLIDREKARGNTDTLRIGDHYTAESLKEAPTEVKEALRRPKFMEERTGVMGFKYDLDAPDSMNEWVEDLVNSYIHRAKHVANRLGHALTAKEYENVLRHDPGTGMLLTTRINQLKGEQLAGSKIQNQIADSVLAPVFGVNSATKVANSFNKGIYHLSLGMGNLHHPVVNTTGILQTTLPEMSNLRTSSLEQLARQGYVFPDEVLKRFGRAGTVHPPLAAQDEMMNRAHLMPVPGKNGKPNGGIAAVTDPIMSTWRGGKIIKSPNQRHLESFQRMADTYKLGPRFVEEFTGESNRHVTRAFTDGVKTADDLGEWFEGLSSFLPANSEKFARTWTAGSAMDMLDTLERLYGFKFPDEMYHLNVSKAIDRTNAVFSQSGRELIFTSPLGSVFGGMKHWMVNYLYLLGDYAGLAMKEGNYAPIMTALGATAGIGGLFAVPFAGGALDWMTETFADKDVMEYMYEGLGTGANPIAFGLPALLGLSLSGSTAAPGSHLTHDVEFLTGIVGLDRLGNMGRALGRYWDLQSITGQDPWSDPLFMQQFLQGFSPRALYRAYDVYSDEALSSAGTGNPMVNLEGRRVSQLASALGFTPVEVEREYAIYDRLLRDREERSKMIGYFGEAYMRASTSHDAVMMEEILRVATMRGLDTSSILRSATTRARNLGVDMFGRNIPDELLAEYDSAIGAR